MSAFRQLLAKWRILFSEIFTPSSALNDTDPLRARSAKLVEHRTLFLRYSTSRLSLPNVPRLNHGIRMRIQANPENAFRWFFWMLFWISLGVYVSVSRIIDEPTEFCSTAKLVTAHGFAPEIRSQTLSDPRFFNTVISIIESADLQRRALDRVRALHPDLQEVAVRTRASQPKDTAFLNLSANSVDPKYTKIFLNALIDEFLILRKEMREKMGALGSDVAVLEHPSPAVEKLSNWVIPISIGALVGGLAGVAVAHQLRRLTRRAST